jgi:hypothetical protein
MKRTLGVCLLTLISALSSHAQEIRPIITIANVQEKPHTPARHWAWIGSMGFLAAGQFMDYQSSLGKHEVNPIIGNSNGQFNASRGLSLKLAIVGGAIGTQVLVHHFSHNHHSDVMFSGANTVMGSIGLATAIHNYGVPQAK